MNTKITLKGNDEIYQVAQGIDKLCKSIIFKIEQEKEAYSSNIALSKAMYLRSLTKELFEHFLLESQAYDITSTLSVNTELVHSVFENIFSNLYKYADLKQCIKVQYEIKNENLEISIENTKNCKKNTNELFTQIGLRNSKAIMERHFGNLEIIEVKDIFKVVLCFPVK